MPKVRAKRYWTEIRPIRHDYDDIEDPLEEEAYYRQQSRQMKLPDLKNFVVTFQIQHRERSVKPKLDQSTSKK
ncbi:unnamed protein product [Thelazia callipaeda]|uniref:Uncharacterized protein n=1 Tax=Thelazia callipaeda TaxID=103827 RepID=A0A0N5D963_THECL|nr:unnamed protein product [Thelazia callipaeda]